MKKLVHSTIVFFSVAIFAFGAVGCADSPTAPAVHTTAVTVKFVTPPSDEISGENKLDVKISNLTTGKDYTLTLSKPTPVPFPDQKTFYVLQGEIELVVGPIGEKNEYLIKATYFGVDGTITGPSRDVSHMVTLDGNTLFYGDEDGMYFALSCDGRLETTPVEMNSPLLSRGRPYFGVYAAWPGQFAGGTIRISVEELIASEDGSTWQPVFTSYDWSGYGLLPTYRFSKVISYEMGWSTTAQIRPIAGEKFVRVWAAVDYPGGTSQIVTNQLSISGGTEWSNQTGDGYRIFRLNSGGYGGKG